MTGVDDNNTDDESTTVTHTASGGDYDALTATLPVTVVDDDTVGLVFSAESLSVTEGDSASYTLRLATRPTRTVTVKLRSSDTGAVSVPPQFTFSTGNWNQPRPVNVVGVSDGDTADELVTITHTASRGGYGGVSATVTVAVVDDDSAAPRFVFTAESLSVDEGATASYTLRLATRPSGTVTVEVSSSDAGAVSVPTSLTFTRQNWNRLRTITVGGVDDADAADESVTVTHTASGGGYGGVSATVTVAVVDDDGAAPGLVFSRTSLSVTEGATASYTLRLATQPTAAVTVALTSSDTGAVSVPVPASLTFTTGDWDQPRTITVTGVDDADTVDESTTVTHTASGGDYGAVSATLPVTVVDDDDTVGFVFSVESLRVGEGASATYRVWLASPPNVPVRVSLSGSGVSVLPASLTFTTTNWQTSQLVRVTSVDDDDVDGDTSASVTHTAAGGVYQGVSATLPVTEVDDDTVGLVFSPDALSVAEGATASYTVRLASRPTAAVTVTATSGDTGAVSAPVPASLTFTRQNWDLARTVTVDGVDDADAADESVSVTHTASGGDYGAVSATVTVAVVDDESVGLVLSRTSLSVAEGATASYTLRLASQPTATVTVTLRSGNDRSVSLLDPVPTPPTPTTPATSTLTFTTGNWDQPRTITVGGVDDDDAVDELVTVTHTASGGGYGAVSARVTVAVVDDDTVGLMFSPESLSVAEGATASYTVRLATEPTAAVTVALTSSDTGAVSVLPASLTFTTAKGNWDRARTITVGGVDDADGVDESVLVTHTASGGDYGAVSATLPVTVDDDDAAPRLVVSRDALSVGEGATASYTVRLETEPTAAVTVALSSGDTGAVSVLPASLTFTTGNWNQPRTITVTGVADNDTVDESTTVTHTASGGDYGGLTATLPVTVVDDSEEGLVVSRTSLSVTEGDSASYTLRLATRPAGVVTVVVSSGDVGAVSVPAQFTFTRQNWDQPRPVNVVGVDDSNADDELVTVTHTAWGGGYGGVSATVSVTVVDDDTVGFVFSAESLRVTEGASATYRVWLASPPDVPVRVSLSGSGVSVLSASLTFTTTNWQTSQLVRVTSVDDDDVDGDESASVTHTAAGGVYQGVSATLPVTVVDDDSVGLVFSADALSVAEGATASYTVRLASRPTAAVTVALSSGDTGAVSAPLPASLTFTRQNWDQPRTVTVGGVVDADAADESVLVTHTASGGDYQGVSAAVTVTVVDAESVGLVFSRTSLSVTEGDSVSYTLRLASRPTATVTVTLRSGNDRSVSLLDPVPVPPSETAPASSSLTFTTTNWDQDRTVTVGGVDDDDAADESTTVTHTASGGGYSAVSATVTVTVVDDESVGLVVSAESLSVGEGATASYTVRLATEPTAAVTVALTSSDVGAVSVLPASLTFTTAKGNWDRARTITVTGVDDADDVDGSTTVTHTASGGDYGAVSATLPVTVVDDDAVGLVFSRTALSVAEGATALYTVRLATEPTATVTVTATSGDTGAVSVSVWSTLTFTTGNWDLPRTITVGGVDDADGVDESVLVTHTASGGDYGAVSATVTVTVVDDDDAAPPGLVVSAESLSVGEGATASYTVRLETEPTAAVTVALSSGDTGAVSVLPASLTFTTGNWNQPRTITVTGVADNDTVDESTTVTHTASGGDYGGLTATLPVTVVDDSEEGLVVSRTALSVTEGDSASYTLRLATRPAGVVTVVVSSGDVGAVSVPAQFTFTRQNWDQPRPVNVVGVDDSNADDELVTVTHTAWGGGYGGVSATVSVTVVDDDTVGFVFSAESLRVTEGASATYRVWLASPPDVPVRVSLSGSGVSVLSASLTFTTTNWQTSQLVRVTSVDDDDVDGDESASVTHTAAGGVYQGVSATLPVTVVDDDSVGLVFSADALSVAEGATASYTVRLASRPTGVVTVALSSGDTGAVSAPLPASLTFTRQNWDQPRTVTVGGVVDADAADESVLVTHTASGGDYQGVSAAVTVTVVDAESVGLVFSRTSLSVTEGDSVSYTLRLASRPTATVTVTLRSGNDRSVSLLDPVPVPPSETAPASSSLTFTTTNWDQDHTITVGGVDDDDAADESTTVTHTASGGGYSAVSATVTVTVVDDESVGLVVSAESLSVGEGATASYTVRLATEPTAAVTVALTSSDVGAVSVLPASLTFTTAKGNWDRDRTITVTGVDDADDVDGSTTVTHTASGGDYGAVSATLPVTVVDDDAVGLVFSRTALSVAEGATALYTVRLATEPTATVTVTATSGDTGAVSVSVWSTLTFTTTNWDLPRTITVGGVDDADGVDESVLVTHTASGGDYGAVSATVTVTVVDDDDAAPRLVVSRDALSVGEGDSVSYTLRLETEPTAAVTVALTSSDTGAVSLLPASLTFTTGNWNQPRTITVTGVDDNNTDDESTTVTHTASGGDYDALTATLPVTVVDDDTVGLVFSAESLSVTEGDSASYTLRLATRPTRTVTVKLRSSDTGAVSVPPQFTFSTGNWNQPRSVNVVGVSDGDTADELVTITHTASRGGYGGVSATVTVAVVDDDSAAPRFVFTAESLSVDEGATASYTLRLATRPSGTVTVEVSSSDAGAVSVPTSKTFTRQNWNRLRTITVGGVDDADAADESVTVTHTASGGGYGGVSATVTVAVVDDDGAAPGLVFSRTSLSVTEGATASYTLRLATQPTAAVTVALTSSDTGAVSVPVPASLTFTTGDWDQPRTITVTGVDDADTVDESTTVTHTASGGDYGAVSATLPVTVVDDDDTVGFVFSVESLRVGEGASATYRVWLASPPNVPVRVSLSGSGVSVLPASLTFTTTNWQTSQLVRVTSVDDDDVDGDTSASVTHTAAGGVYQGVSATLPVTEVDDDTVGLVFSPDALSVAEGATASYTVRLASRPTAAVTVTATSGDTGAVSAPVPASLTFTRQNWDLARTVTVDGVDDADAADESVSVTHTASGGDYGAVSATVTVAVVDDESVGLVLSRTSLSVAEGATASYTLRLASQPTATVTVTLRSGNDRSVSLLDPVPVPPTPTTPATSTLTFTTGNWDQPRTITVGGVDDDDAVDELVTVTHTASGGGYGAVSARVTVAVVDDDTVGLMFSPESLSVAEGATASYTVRLATEPTAAVTVALTSSDTGAVSVLPASLTFTTAKGNWDRARTITVGGVDDADGVDESVLVTHTASGGDYGAVSATLPVTVDDDDAAPRLVVSRDALSVGEGATASYTVRLETEPTAAVTVALSSGDTGAVSVLPASLTFTTGNWNQPRTITVTGVADNDTVDESTTVTHTASGGDYGGLTATLPVTVVDDSEEGLVVSRTSLSVTEGDSASYTLRLATRPAGVVTVVVSSGDVGAVSVPAQFTFTRQNWDQPRPVNVVGVDDSNADDELVTVTHTAWGGGYGGVSATVSVTVVDDDTVGFVFSAESLRVTEGASATYRVWLASPPDVPVRVSLSGSGVSVLSASLTFTTTNWQTSQLVRVTSVDDDDVDGDESASVTHTAAGGVYQGVSATLPVTVVDDDSVGLVFSADALSVAEGATASYTVRLASRPTAAVTVALSSGDTGAVSAPLPASLTFTRQNWDQPRTVTVGGVVDADAADESVLVTHTASGGDYQGVSAAVTVTVVDAESVGLVFSRTSLSVTEGDSVSYTLRLASRPTATVTVTLRSGNDRSVSLLDPVPVPPSETAPASSSLTFTTTNWDQDRTVTVGGVDDDDAADESTTVTHTASGDGYSAVSATVTVTVVDDESVGLVVSAESLSVGEGATASYTVRLATEPTAAVTVALTSSDVGAVSVLPASLTFTTAKGNWDRARTITVTGVDDADDVDGSTTVTHTASGGDYGAVSATLPVTVVDDDAVGLVFSRTALSVAEGATALYTVRLATEPTATVTVTATSGDTGAVSVSVWSTLTFTTGNWDLPRTITVGGVDDADGVDESVLVTHTASGGDYGAVSATVTVTVVDDDDAAPPGLVVSAESLSVGEGATASYTVRLETEPTAAVTVALSSGDTGAVSVLPASLTFTTGNWNQPRTITVTGVADNDTVDESTTVTHTASGGDYGGLTATLPVTVVDDSEEGLVVSRTSLSVTEGDSASYTLRLATRPAGVVTVVVSSGDVGAVSVPAQFTFTRQNWDQPRPVNVVGVDDSNADDELVTVTHTAWGGGYGGVSATVSVTVVDDDTVGFVFSAESLRVTEGRQRDVQGVVGVAAGCAGESVVVG